MQTKKKKKKKKSRIGTVQNPNGGVYSNIPLTRRERDANFVARDPKATERLMKILKQVELTNASKCPRARNIDELLMVVPTILDSTFPNRDVLKKLMLELRDVYIDQTVTDPNQLSLDLKTEFSGEH